MCGIAASFNKGGRARALNLERLRHRGPDARGEWTSVDGGAWLGHTRLAIIDRSPTGAQPMVDPETGNVIIFNGEIYNHRAVRDELDLPSKQWRGSSDTETLLAAFRIWGEDLLPRLKGMFAFVIYQPRWGEVFAARDRFGMKPFYYEHQGDEFTVASEARVMDRGASLENVERGRLADYFRTGAFPEDSCLSPGMRELPAGHWLRIRAGGELETGRYWPKKAFRSSSQGCAAEIRRLLEKSVQEHLLADVPVASFLSGGIDSSIVTALAARGSDRRLQTFSVGFDDAAFDETGIAMEVARRYGTDHHLIRLTSDQALKHVCEAVERLDVLSVDAINTYIVARSVSEHGIRVALSGLGGDELFGGYPSFSDVPRLKWMSRLPAAFLRTARNLGPVGARLSEMPTTGNVFDLAVWRRRFWTDAMLQEAALPISPARTRYEPDFPDDFSRISWAELTGYMKTMLLKDSDQMSMAVSLELRVPFLDHELVEYVLGLPAEEKEKSKRPKGLLIEACADLLPPSVYGRPKMGFALPMDTWMRGPLQTFCASGIKEVVDREILSARFTASLSAQFTSRRLHWTRLWSVVVLGHYLARRR